MGFYLNAADILELYRSETKRPYFVDKSGLLAELIPLVEEGKNYICITRPRRFGKSVMATMIGSYFGKGEDASDVFAHLDISKHSSYKKHLNQHDLIYVDFSKAGSRIRNFDAYLDKISQNLTDDILRAFPDTPYKEWDSVSDLLKRTGRKFIFVFDEWDYIFHKPYVTDDDKRNYIGFLTELTKGQAYAEMVYMTGILPIAKYSSGSSLNHFSEYTMGTQPKFSEYFGFTDEEVDVLYSKYLSAHPEPKFTREDLRYWYDGYCALDGKRMYNPRSVVRALSDNMLSNYWTRSGPFTEVAEYIRDHALDGLNEAIALMVAGESVAIRLTEAAAAEKQFRTVDQILSAMVVYGFLSYHMNDYGQGTVCIPNKELMDEFVLTLEQIQ